MLGLETEARPLTVNAPALSFNSPIEKIAGIELQSRLCRASVEPAAARRILQPRRMHERPRPPPLPRAIAVDHPIVVVAAPEPELLMLVVDARSNRGCPAKIERRSRHRGDLAGRNQRRINRRKRGRVERQNVIEYVAPIAMQVPVRVLREIDRRRLGR